jgi:hypothetical protein
MRERFDGREGHGQESDPRPVVLLNELAARLDLLNAGVVTQGGNRGVCAGSLGERNVSLLRTEY